MRWGRLYFAFQALAGTAWWLAVFSVPWVREITLAGLDPVIVAIVDVPLFVLASALAAPGLRALAVAATGWTFIVTLALFGYSLVTGEAAWGVILMAGASGCSLIALALMLLGRVPTDWLLVGPFAIREARPMNYLWVTIAQMLVFWGVFLVLAPLVIAWVEQRWGLHLDTSSRPFGAVLIALASALGVWSAIAMSRFGEGTPLPMATARRLVMTGPYRWVRNPMAIAGIVQGVAVGLILSSWLVVGYALIGSLLWNYAIRPHEEADLEKRFGQSYRLYRDRVRCWLPSFN